MSYQNDVEGVVVNFTVEEVQAAMNNPRPDPSEDIVSANAAVDEKTAEESVENSDDKSSNSKPKSKKASSRR